jgi:hypothetical protein
MGLAPHLPDRINRLVNSLDAVFQLFDSSLGSTSITLLTLSREESCATFENARYDE